MESLKKKNKVEATKAENRERLAEIIKVLGKHEIMKGLTPEKLVAVIQDLGPTFIKIGQILSLRSDILPVEYCAALAKLQSRVPPMPYEEVEGVFLEAFGHTPDEIFAEFSREALGSASIGQVHRAKLKNGTDVVVKVQRPGIREKMSRDIALLHHAVALTKLTSMGSVIDWGQVLNEMWITAQQELNYQTEADNLEKFRELNKDVAFVTSPTLYRDFTTSTVLTMEYTAGFSMRKLDEIKAAGYDLTEIGTKLADNYIKQVMEDGFFHADPHPGNLHVRDGKIVWMDMGMMGTITEQERKLLCRIIVGLAQGNVRAITEACMKLGKFHSEVDVRALERDIETYCGKFDSDTKLSSIDLSATFNELIDIIKRHDAEVPGDLTMMVRGILTIEGVVEKLSPDVNIIGIAAARISAFLIRDFDIQAEIAHDVKTFGISARKAIALPGLLNDMLTTIMSGETKMELALHMGKDMSTEVDRLFTRFCASIICAALIMFAGLFSEQGPKVGNLPFVSTVALLAAAGICVYVFLLRPRRKRK